MPDPALRAAPASRLRRSSFTDSRQALCAGTTGRSQGPGGVDPAVGPRPSWGASPPILCAFGAKGAEAPLRSQQPWPLMRLRAHEAFHEREQRSTSRPPPDTPHRAARHVQ